MAVIVGHPGRQHSHHLAQGLYAAGMLDIFCSGQFDQQRLNNLPVSLRRILPKSVVRAAVPCLGRGVHVARPLGIVVHRVFSRVPLASLRKWGEFVGFATFDVQLAKLVAARKSRVVIAYEMAALHTFRAAKKEKTICILDAAACHHSLQDRRLNVSQAEMNSVPGRAIRARKDAEVLLADLVICPSVLSAESYLAAGVPAGKVVVNTLGVDADAFDASSQVVRTGVPSFVFIANAAYVKGADRVAAVIADLQARNVPALFHIVGSARLDSSSRGCVQVLQHGPLSASELSRVLGTSDCLLLPSRLESFGMVVLEAMAAGVAVLVSRWSGASTVVQQGVNGWTFDSDTGEFSDLVRWCADNIIEVRAMREQCVEIAAAHSWASYQERAVGIIRNAMRSSCG